MMLCAWPTATAMIVVYDQGAGSGWSWLVVAFGEEKLK